MDKKKEGEIIWKLAIVDDDPMIIRLSELMLSQLAPDLEVISFKDGQLFCDHLQKLKSESHARPDFNYLVLLDINMPNKNGHEVLASIDEKGFVPFVEVAMLSSSIYQEDREKSLVYPFVREFLEKPLRRAVLERLLKEMDLLNSEKK